MDKTVSGHHLTDVEAHVKLGHSFYEAIGVLTVLRKHPKKRNSHPIVTRMSRFVKEVLGLGISPNVTWIPYLSKRDRKEKIEDLLMAARGADVYIQDSSVKQFKQMELYLYKGVR